MLKMNTSVVSSAVILFEVVKRIGFSDSAGECPLSHVLLLRPNM